MKDVHRSSLARWPSPGIKYQAYGFMLTPSFHGFTSDYLILAHCFTFIIYIWDRSRALQNHVQQLTRTDNLTDMPMISPLFLPGPLTYFAVSTHSSVSCDPAWISCAFRREREREYLT